MYRRLCCDWLMVVRGAQPLVGGHGFNRVGSFGGRGSQSFPVVKPLLHALLSRLLFQQLKAHVVSQTVSHNEASLGDRSPFHTFSVWWVTGIFSVSAHFLLFSILASFSDCASINLGFVLFFSFCVFALSVDMFFLYLTLKSCRCQSPSFAILKAKSVF